MRYVPVTKKDRLALVEQYIAGKIDSGFALETYKGLRILTKTIEERLLHLCVYRDAAAHPIVNQYYRNAEQMGTAIENLKKNYDRRIEYKAEAKKNPTVSTAANCAKAIRTELAQAFPAIKFSVTSDNFAGGDAVRIGWNDGPTTREVEAITDKYQRGHFNGMEDIYEYNNSREDIPQTKYVTISRSMSHETRATLDPIAVTLFEGRESNSLWRLFQATSLPAGAKVTSIETTDQSGGIEDFYRIAYEAPVPAQTKSEETQIEKVEVQPGTIQIIEYGRGIAVIGDTKPIKDLLGRKGLGGKFNPALTCGPGWIFRRDDLERVTEALQPKQKALPPAPQTNTLRDEIVKTVEWFAETDKEQNGFVSQETRQIARTQNVELKEEVREFDNIEDITKAAESGEVVSLLNLYNIVNKKEPVNAVGVDSLAGQRASTTTENG